MAAIAMAVIAVTETAFPAMIKPLLDKGFSGTVSFRLWWVPAAIIAIFVIRGAASFASTYLMSWVAGNVLRDLRRAMYDRLLVMPSSSYDDRSSGLMISKVVAEVNGVTIAATNVLNTVVRDSLILIGLLCWLFWVNWLLSLIVLSLAPLLVMLTLVFSRRMRKVSRAAVKATGELTRSVEETIAGQKLIKLFQAEGFERDRFDQTNRDYRAQGMRVVIAQALQAPISQLIVAFGVAVIITIALAQAQSGSATIGDFVSFITAMLLLLSPIRHLADVNAQLQRGLASAESVFTMIDEKSEIDKGKYETRRALGMLRFHDVSLVYTKTRRPALEKISLDIEAGETIALVGPSGGGKTSLASLIPRLYDPTSGKVMLDGKDVRDYSLKSLRAQISVVPQEIILMNDTLEQNIAYGCRSIDQGRLKAALTLSSLEDFVATLPEGLKTNIGDRGAKLSGGQRQRLAIARAAYRDTPILILDEATSALDGISEKQVQAAFENLQLGRTTIVIAHRLSTIKIIPRIIVLDSGVIVAEGSHQSLLSSCDLYQRITADLDRNLAEDRQHRIHGS
jgi:subfamily B ATP-binding cassette protein MsbA